MGAKRWLKVHAAFTEWVETDPRIDADKMEVLRATLPTGEDTKALRALCIVLFSCHAREKGLEDPRAPTGVLNLRFTSTLWNELSTLAMEFRNASSAQRMEFKAVMSNVPGTYRMGGKGVEGRQQCAICWVLICLWVRCCSLFYRIYHCVASWYIVP